MSVYRPVAAMFAVATLLSMSASVPVLAQSGAATSITHRQSVRTDMSPSGEIDASRVFTQLTVQGEGDVEVVLPDQATRSLRNLDAFGRPDIDGDQVTFSVVATPDGTHERTVATHSGPMPIELEVAYRLDGSTIAPEDLVGGSGQLEVSYTVRNTTAEPTEITYRDGVGAKHTETIDVAVPFVGSISMELDGRFVGIDAPGAAVAGNGRGDTFVSWSMVLFEPVGSEEQTVTYTAQVTDAIVPAVVAQFLPVDSNSFTSLASVEETFGAVADGLREIAGGGLQIDANLQALAIGAGQLLSGVTRLANGGERLADGLNETAIPGARQLAEGTGAASDGGQRLSSGLGELSAGAGELSAGLGRASTGGSELATGLGQLEAGAGQVNTGIAGVRAGVGNTGDTATDETVIGGVNALRAGVAGVPTSVGDALETNLQQALNGIVLPQLRDNLEAGLERNIAGALQAQVKPPLVSGVEDGIRTNLNGALQTQLRPQLVMQLQGAVEAGLTTSLGPALQSQLATNLAAALQAPPPNGLGLDEATATAFANAFASQFASAFAQGFAQQFAQGFAQQVDPQLEAAFAQVADQFATGFAAGFEPQLTAAFDQFAAAFAPQFAAGFAAQVEPSFTVFAEQFAAQFAAGLDATLNEEALPGFDRLLGGLDNPSCDLDDPTNPANPCGVRQVLALLDSGSSRLAAGASAASAGANDLSSGLGQLDAGGQRLAAGASTAAAGSRDLASGLGQLDDGTNQLADGLGDAGDGATTIAEGLRAVEEGMTGVAEGSQRLTDEGTSQLVAGASEATASPAIAVEHAILADARGQAGEGLPYPTVDGAEASAVYQFELAGIGSEDGGTSLPVLLLATLLGLAVAGGLALVVRQRMG
jgi:putative membrane protein